MKFTRLKLPEIIRIEPKIHADNRGAFWEWYRKDLYAAHEIMDQFVQDNQSSSVKGVLRGLHWQVQPMAQAKIVRAIRGRIFDVAVDIRPSSKTFGRWVAEVLSDENRRILYIPAGFAHGFLTLSDEAEVHYKVSQFYSLKDDRGIFWNDPEVGIEWPDLGMEYLVSEKDKRNSLLSSLKKSRV